MKITKCDRCKRLDELAGAYSFGITSFYIGAVKLYQYYGQEIEPGIKDLDLCRECQGELDEFVNKFMEKDNEN